MTSSHFEKQAMTRKGEGKRNQEPPAETVELSPELAKITPTESQNDLLKVAK